MNATEELSYELCYCNTQDNILYYLVAMPFIASIGGFIIHMIDNIVFCSKLNEMYKIYITTLNFYYIYFV